MHCNQRLPNSDNIQALHLVLQTKRTIRRLHCINTQKETAGCTATGLRLGARSCPPICYWKDNIFVLSGGFVTPSVSDSCPQKWKVLGVQFLEVIEENYKDNFLIDFEVFSSEDFFQRETLWNSWWWEVVGNKSHGTGLLSRKGESVESACSGFQIRPQ